MPDSEIESVTSEWLQSELRTSTQELIILDCRSSNEYIDGHIRMAVNFSIPSIMLRRLAAGKIDITTTIKCRELKNRILSGYSGNSVFVLYNDTPIVTSPSNLNMINTNTSNNDSSSSSCNNNNNNNNNTSDAIINVLHRRLKQDGCRVFCLQDGFTSFRDAFPEWCEDDSSNNESQANQAQAEQLMGLRSLRISTAHSDSACSSSAESSDNECNPSHPSLNGAPVEILPGLFLGNVSHSADSIALQKYNIRYILNVTKDLPNVFEGTGRIEYLKIPITDSFTQDLALHFPVAIRFIDEARRKGSAVLVHCLAGVSRSVTMTLAYLMHTCSLCLNDAFSLVRARKPDVSPNFHFMEQLHCFESQLKTDPNRTPLSAASDSEFHTPIDFDKIPRTTTKYSCGCLSVDCKCMQTDFLGHTTGVSPDSGIEFDRWTPGDGTPK